MRGRIVYPVGEQLHAVDPADPSSVRSLDLPVRVPHVVPAGWSADGTRLALTSEGELGSLVMDANGGITKVSGPGGCCAFVSDPWLSPDGTTAVDSTFGDRLRLRDLTSPDASRTVTLQSRVRGLGWGPKAWSPDGTRIAVTAQRRSTAPLSVEVVDLRTGAVRHLVPPAFGHVRQMAWSPDGSQLLVVAGPWQPTPGAHPMQNPLMSPHETGLYLVDTDPTAGPAPPDRIAFSYYVAATWSPDGTEIAAIDYYTLHSLIVMRADGSSPRVVVESMKSGWFTGLAWHPKPRP